MKSSNQSAEKYTPLLPLLSCCAAIWKVSSEYDENLQEKLTAVLNCFVQGPWSPAQQDAIEKSLKNAFNLRERISVWEKDGVRYEEYRGGLVFGRKIPLINLHE